MMREIQDDLFSYPAHYNSGHFSLLTGEYKYNAIRIVNNKRSIR